MSNRLAEPNIQFFDDQGRPLAGGKLWTYLTGTSTPAATYSDAALAVPNTNPIILDSAGRAGDVFLDETTYKLVLMDANDVIIWTKDPVTDLAANVNATISVYAGDPNGNVAGNQGTVGGSGASMVWDITDNVLYVCTTSGDAASAAWTPITSDFTGIEDVWTADQAIDAGALGRIQVANKASTITFNLDAVATLGAGFIFPFKNIGTGNLVLDPNGAETIEGASTLTVYPGEFGFAWTNGLVWRAGKSLSTDHAQAKAALQTPWSATEAIYTADHAVTTADAGVPLIANKATTINFTLLAAASAGADLYFLRNINAGVAVIDPNGAETIEGAANFLVFQNEAAIFWSTGAAWRAVKFPYLSLKDDGAGAGPDWSVFRDSASPAVSDLLGRILFKGRDSAGNVTDYAQIVAKILDPTDATEDAAIIIRALVAGAATDILTIGPGVQVGAPTGADPGAGGINFEKTILFNGAPVMPRPAGRLTFSSGNPVMVSDLTAQATIYWALYGGDTFPWYDGTRWTIRKTTQLSLALDSNAAHTGYHQSGKIQDLFLTDDAGTLRLVSGPSWTNDTTRANAISLQDGIYVNTGSLTARFGSASGNTITMGAAQGTYVGSVRFSADGQSQWVANPAAAAGGGNCQLLLWNMYNRVDVMASSRDSTDSWTYATATWRSANNNAANRISALMGLNEDPVDVSYSQFLMAGAAGLAHIGIGIDSTSALSGHPSAIGEQGTAATRNKTYPVAEWRGFLGLGFHYAQALEYADGGSSSDFFGDNGAASLDQQVLSLSGRM